MAGHRVGPDVTQRVPAVKTGTGKAGPKAPGYRDKSGVGPSAATADYRAVPGATTHHVSVVAHDGSTRTIPATSATHAAAIAHATPDGHARVHEGPPVASQTGPRGGSFTIGPSGAKIYK